MEENAKRKQYKGPGHKLVAEIVSMKAPCAWGHEVGETFTVGVVPTGGMCGTLYHAAFPHIEMLQFGGKLPPTWAPPDEVSVDCADRKCSVRVRIRRVD